MINYFHHIFFVYIVYRTGKTVLSAIDHMDDGSKIKLTVTIDETVGSALCDFTGSGFVFHIFEYRVRW